jgi:hypothetical protein
MRSSARLPSGGRFSGCPPPRAPASSGSVVAGFGIRCVCRAGVADAAKTRRLRAVRRPGGSLGRLCVGRLEKRARRRARSRTHSRHDSYRFHRADGLSPPGRVFRHAACLGGRSVAGANAAAHPADGSLPSAGRSRRVRETEGAAVAARDAYFAELGAVGNMRRDYAESSGRSLRDAHGALLARTVPGRVRHARSGARLRIRRNAAILVRRTYASPIGLIDFTLYGLILHFADELQKIFYQKYAARRCTSLTAVKRAPTFDLQPHFAILDGFHE